MKLAQQALEQNNLGRAWELLNHHRPKLEAGSAWMGVALPLAEMPKRRTLRVDGDQRGDAMSGLLSGWKVPGGCHA